MYFSFWCIVFQTWWGILIFQSLILRCVAYANGLIHNPISCLTSFSACMFACCALSNAEADEGNGKKSFNILCYFLVCISCLNGFIAPSRPLVISIFIVSPPYPSLLSLFFLSFSHLVPLYTFSHTNTSLKPNSAILLNKRLAMKVPNICTF